MLFFDSGGETFVNSDFPRILTLLRKEQGISQKKAAADLGISQALLSHYEKGIRECGLDFIAVSYTHLDVYKRQREKLRCGKQQCDEQEYAPRFYKLYAETLADRHDEQCEHKQNKRCGTNQNQIQKHG